MVFDFLNLDDVSTERLKLRKIEQEDVEDIFTFTSSPVGKEFLSWQPHDNIERTNGFVNSIITKYKNGSAAQWGIELVAENKIIGLTGFIDYSADNCRGEIAYIMSPYYEGKGYMTEANLAVINYGFEVIKLNRIQAKAELDNVGSQKVLERIGMKEEGTLRQFIFQKGKYRDYKMFAILSTETNTK